MNVGDRIQVLHREVRDQHDRVVGVVEEIVPGHLDVGIDVLLKRVDPDRAEADFQFSSYVPARTVVLSVIRRFPVNASEPKRDPTWIPLPSRIGSAMRLPETVLSVPP